MIRIIGSATAVKGSESRPSLHMVLRTLSKFGCDRLRCVYHVYKRSFRTVEIYLQFLFSKRIGEWEKLTAKLHGRKKLIRLENLGKIRWYLKEKALTKAFGSFSNPSTEIYKTLLEFLKIIKKSPDYDFAVSLEADFLLDKWTKIDIILTSFTFLKIFEVFGHISKYFRQQGLDLFAAWTMLQSSI